jgi:hypothetical protein
VLFFVVLILYAFVSFSDIQLKEVEEWDVDDISFTSAKGTCRARVFNPSWYSVNCKSLEFQLFYNDKEVGKAVLKEPTELSGNEETFLPLSFEFNFSNFGRAEITDLFKDSVEFQTVLKGTATWLNFSFEEKGKINLSVKNWIKSRLPDFIPGDWLKLNAYTLPGDMPKYLFPLKRNMMIGPRKSEQAYDALYMKKSV